MSPRTSTWLYRLLALGIAVSMWYVNTAEKVQQQGEKTVEAGVTYTTPKGLILMQRIDEVDIRLRGNNRDLRQIRPFEIDVEVDLTGQTPGAVSIKLDSDNVLLPFEDLEVVSIDPSVVTLELDQEENKRVPIEIGFVGEPAAGAIVKGSEVVPNTALLSGPRSRLQAVVSVKTAAIDLATHASTFQRVVPLLSPDPLIRVIQPTTVNVLVDLGDPPPATGRGAAGGR